MLTAPSSPLSLITPLASPTLTFHHFYIYLVSLVLSCHNPRHASCLGSLRIFQPTDGIFFCFVSVHFSLVRDTQTTDLSSCDSHRFAFACLCVHLIIKKMPVYVCVITFSFILASSAYTCGSVSCLLILSHLKQPSLDMFSDSDTYISVYLLKPKQNNLSPPFNYKQVLIKTVPPGSVW